MPKTPTKALDTHSGYKKDNDLYALDDFSNLEDVENVKLVSRENSSDFGLGSTMLEILEKELPGSDVVLEPGETSYLLLPRSCGPEIVKEIGE